MYFGFNHMIKLEFWNHGKYFMLLKFHVASYVKSYNTYVTQISIIVMAGIYDKRWFGS